MIETILGILLIFVLAPNDDKEHDPGFEFKNSTVPVERQVEQDEHSDEDCRYTAESIPHRDLSDYVVLEEISSESTGELNEERSEITEQKDSEKIEEVQDQLELTSPNEEEQD
ncbi:MAG: hypothetical protein F4227_10050 [Gammaproteobacteria bacterium]|nr:hypothetical protein [Gammaproteobacteria bacterium]MYF03280.1 hypothetical protein [Gammaproteobacteria bacterium]MYI77474.1 hypothetical protein [Gammaproteobacteria bacterium]